jgi:preprotein translocase subunit Sec63
MTDRIEEFIELIERGSLSNIYKFFNNIPSNHQKNILNSCDACGEYPLHVAVKTNNEELVKWLVENGSDINQTNYWGSTASQIAERKEYTKIQKLITTTKKKPESFKEAQNMKGSYGDESENVKKETLDKANAIIRTANYRIEELKSLLISKDEEIDDLKATIEELHSMTNTFSRFSEYEILGVEGSEDVLRLKKNYKALASIYHPDRCGSGSIMKIINNAYDEIKNSHQNL